MTRIKNFILKAQIVKDTKGQDLIEYALLAGFLAVAAAAAVPAFSGALTTLFGNINTSLTTAAS